MEDEEIAKTFTEKLIEVQQLLNAPKSQYNKFGGFSYRSAEDIVQAVKPLLHERGLLLTMTDGVQDVGGWKYTQAAATVTNGVESVVAFGNAREPEQKKGMDSSQISGACSSYARKYALCGLFAIDDGQDVDSAEPEKPTPKTRAKNPEPDSKKKQAWRLMIECCGGDKELATASFNEYRGRDDYEDCDGFWSARIVELQAELYG